MDEEERVAWVDDMWEYLESTRASYFSRLTMSKPVLEAGKEERLNHIKGLQRELYEVVRGCEKSKLFDHFKEGKVSIKSFMKMIRKKGDEKFGDMLSEDYNLIALDAMEISDRMEKLIEAKNQNPDVYAEFSIQQLLELGDEEEEKEEKKEEGGFLSKKFSLLSPLSPSFRKKAPPRKTQSLDSKERRPRNANLLVDDDDDMFDFSDLPPSSSPMSPPKHRIKHNNRQSSKSRNLYHKSRDLGSSSSQNLSFSPPLNEQLLQESTVVESESEIVRMVVKGHDQYTNTDVTVKCSDNLVDLENEHDNLVLMSEFTQSHPELQGSFCSEVFGAVLENFVSHPIDGTFLHGIVVNQGHETMKTYLKNRSSHMSENDRRSLVEKLVDVVQFVHECGFIWLNCGLESLTHHPTSFPEWKGVNFESTLRNGKMIPSDLASSINKCASPELFRHCDLIEEGEKSSLVSHPSMDMWSVGVCLVEIVTGKEFSMAMGLGRGKEALKRFYCDNSDIDIEKLVEKMATSCLKNQGLRSVVMDLLRVDSDLRLTTAGLKRRMNESDDITPSHLSTPIMQDILDALPEKLLKNWKRGVKDDSLGSLMENIDPTREVLLFYTRKLQFIIDNFLGYGDQFQDKVHVLKERIEIAVVIYQLKECEEELKRLVSSFTSFGVEETVRMEEDYTSLMTEILEYFTLRTSDKQLRGQFQVLAYEFFSCRDYVDLKFCLGELLGVQQKIYATSSDYEVHVTRHTSRSIRMETPPTNGQIGEGKDGNDHHLNHKENEEEKGVAEEKKKKKKKRRKKKKREDGGEEEVDTPQSSPPPQEEEEEGKIGDHAIVEEGENEEVKERPSSMRGAPVAFLREKTKSMRINKEERNKDPDILRENKDEIFYL